MRQPAWSAILKCFEKRWVILAQQRAELVGHVLSIPDGILLGACQ